MQFYQVQKMEALGVLTGGVAHDFNNLLTAIQGWTELLFRSIDKKSPAYQDLEKIHFAVKRATDLTQQLLYVSRKKPMRRISVDLNDLVTGFMQICQRLIGENIAITAHFADDLNTMRADPSMIEQIVMNLVVNARDAMPHGGKIVIRTGNAFIDEAECRNDLDVRPGKFVRLTVSDNGTGMNPQTLQRIFEPFYTTKAVGKGTGLGLSVIYGIVKQHSGWIKVQSESGKGTTFDVYLPAVETENNEATKAPDAREVQHGRGERILVVEDEANLAEFIKKALSRNGYTVFLACTISEARTIFKDEKGRFDLVFSDVVLPDGNGIHLIDVFKRYKPGLPVILSSGYSDHKLQLPLIEERGYRFLKKPYTMLELMQNCQKEMKPDRRG
jgi:two-component system cell cycle sensor histidine kinase/response regulator CckA